MLLRAGDVIPLLPPSVPSELRPSAVSEGGEVVTIPEGGLARAVPSKMHWLCGLARQTENPSSVSGYFHELLIYRKKKKSLSNQKHVGQYLTGGSEMAEPKLCQREGHSKHGP